DSVAGKLLDHGSPSVRSWAIRLAGETGEVSATLLAGMTKLAEKDPAPQVRLQLASTAQRLTKQDTLPLLHNLFKHWQDAKDPYLPLMIWLAYEPRVTAQ